MKKLITLILSLLTAPVLLATCTIGASGNCEVGAGKTYATIGACLSAMSAGQTCQVFAGTYTENPTIPSGTVGNYNTVQANGSDVVSVNGNVTLNSHTKLIGNCPVLQGTVTSASCGFFISQPSSPTSYCITVAGSSTDYYIEFNQTFDCHGISDSGASFGFFIGNTLSWPCATPAAPNACMPLQIGAGNAGGNHKFIENNDISHFTDGARHGSNTTFTVYRGNSFHDAHTKETGTNDGDTHLDEVEFSGNGDTFDLLESNTVVNWFVDGNCSGCESPANHGGPIGQCVGGPCGKMIMRFQQDAHIQGAVTTMDQGNWPNAKEYNNTFADVQNGVSGGSVVNNQQNETSGANLNEIYTFITNPTGTTHTYYYASTTSGSKFGFALGFCPNESNSACASGLTGANNESFLSDTGNQVADPTFVNYSSSGLGDLHLKVGSPAIGAGTNLTTANGSGTNSTTLIVNDANYFQDGWGFPSGTGLGQMVPDCLRIGASTTVCVAAGGINYSTNTITLATAVSWSNGDPIYLYKNSVGMQVLFGTNTSPDLGALPFVSNVPPLGISGSGSISGTGVIKNP